MYGCPASLSFGELVPTFREEPRVRLNRKLKVQECDATMLIEKQLLGSK